VVGELAPDPSDVRVDKHHMSGFWDTELVDAACIGYDVVMLEDCSATTSPAYCWEATVYNVRQCFGFTALAADLVAAIGGPG
jgi:nicotinamidase-related amidase